MIKIHKSRHHSVSLLLNVLQLFLAGQKTERKKRKERGALVGKAEQDCIKCVLPLMVLLGGTATNINKTSQITTKHRSSLSPGFKSFVK